MLCIGSQPLRAAVQTQQNKELLVGQKMEDRLAKAAAFVRERLGMTPQVGVVLGSGLGDFAALVEADCILPYADIPGFPTTTVEGHAGRFVFGRLDGVPVAVMQGRVHYYEGYDMADVVMPIRLMRLLGVKSVVLTNASGGINPALKPGTFMLVTDHLFFLVPSPLRGANLDSLGLRFPDMSQVYDSDLLDLARKSAAAEGVELHEGVYIQTAGPISRRRRKSGCTAAWERTRSACQPPARPWQPGIAACASAPCPALPTWLPASRQRL